MEGVKTYILTILDFKIMELKELQKMSYAIIEDYNKKHGLKHHPETVFPHLVEEVGELARELNHCIDNWRGQCDKERVAEEMADVIDQVFNLATDHNIDLEAAFLKKMKHYRQRFELD